MFLMNRRSLTFKLAWRALLLSSIALISVCVSIWYSIYSALAYSRQHLEETLNELVYTIDINLSQTESNLIALGEFLHLTNDVDQTLAEYLDRNPFVFNVRVYDENNTITDQLSQAQLPTFPHGVDIAPLAPLSLSSSAQWGEVVFDETGNPFTTLATPVLADDGFLQHRDAGQVVVLVDLTSFWNLVRGVQVEDTGYGYIVNEAGYLLAHRDIALVQQNANIPVFSGDIHMSIMQRTTALDSLRRGLNDQPVLAVQRQLQTVPWFLVVEQNRDEVLRNVYPIVAISALAILLVVVLIVSVFQFTYSQIIVPLSNMRLRIDLFRKGYTEQRFELPHRTVDEIEELAHTFNHMADSIEQRTHELIDANRRAEEGSKLKSEFLSIVSHELRTPLNAIMGYCGVMLEGLQGELDEKALTMVTRIDANGHRLLHLINELLDLSKLDSGRFKLHMREFDVHRMVELWEKQSAGLVQNKNITLNFDIDDTLPTTLYGDPDRITQVTSNLISNAVKFTEVGSIRVEVTNHIKQWEIRVMDTGIGMPPDASGYIFDRFRQVDSSTTREYEGTGLGLTIVKDLTLLMGGSIRVESELRKGSTFIIKLPILSPPESA